jgi:hypothetical protein
VCACTTETAAGSQESGGTALSHDRGPEEFLRALPVRQSIVDVVTPLALVLLPRATAVDHLGRERAERNVAGVHP